MNTPEVIKAIRYGSQITVFLVFLLSRVFGQFYARFHKPAERNAGVAFTLKYLAWAILVAYLSQTVTAAVLAVSLRHSDPDLIVDSVSGILVWLLIATYDDLNWHSYATCALTTGLFDIALLALNARSPAKFTIESGFRISKLVLCVFMIIVALSTLLYKVPKLCEESEPLLPSTDAPTTAKKDEEDADDWHGGNKRWNNELRDRLAKDSGSWLGYLKAFRVFVPYLVPKNDRSAQACIATFLLCLVAQRALNLLIPRQLGIVADQLNESASGSHNAAPFTALWIYLALNNLPLSLIQGRVEIPITMSTYRRINLAAFTHLMSLGVDFHDNEDASELYIAVHQGTAVQELLLLLIKDVLPALADMVIAFWYFGHLFDFYVSYTVVVAAACYIFCQSKFTMWNRPLRRTMIKEARAAGSTMFRAISSWRNVLYFNRFDHENSQYSEAIDTYQLAEKKYDVRQYLKTGVEDIIVGIAFAVVASLVVLLISQHNVPVGSFVVLITYWGRLWSPIRRMSFYFSRLNQNLLDAERLLWLFLTKPVITDNSNAHDLVVTNANITFKNVDFSYDPRKPTLQDITFDASSGTTALVGETGGGKSTIFKLLQRFYDVNNGSIEIDGQDIRNITLNSLRNSIGVVPQDPFLFNLSIMKNVRYGRLDASDEEVYEACRAASIHDKILTFPDGYDSVVGDRGIKLSGGELQRLAIARCLLKNPKILLLDEASSAVDSETEAHIQNALSKLTSGRTTFAIAHRLSTIAKAEKILVIHGGKIVESGTHAELLQRGARYHQLWSMQVANTLNLDKTEPGDKGAFDFSADDPPPTIPGAIAAEIAKSHIEIPKEASNPVEDYKQAFAPSPKTEISNSGGQVEEIKAKFLGAHQPGVKGTVEPISEGNLGSLSTKPDDHNANDLANLITDHSLPGTKGKEKSLEHHVGDHTAGNSEEQDPAHNFQETPKNEAKAKAKHKQQRRKQSQSNSAPAANMDIADTPSKGTHAQEPNESSEPSKGEEEVVTAATAHHARGIRRGSTWRGRGSRGRGGWNGRRKKGWSESEANDSPGITQQPSAESSGHSSAGDATGPSKTNTSVADEESESRDTSCK